MVADPLPESRAAIFPWVPPSPRGGRLSVRRVSLDAGERISIPPFPGSNPGAPSQPVRSLRCDFQVWENRRHSRGLAGNGRVFGEENRALPTLRRDTPDAAGRAFA